MSHYPVYVIAPDEYTVEELLAPYSENLEVEPYIESTKAEIIEKGREQQALISECMEDPSYVPNGYETSILALKSDEDIYNYYTEGRTLDEDGNVLSTYNPNSKWDWYSFGGRWDNDLKTKSGENVDACLVEELDISLDREVYKRAERFWEVVIEKKPLEKGENKDQFTSFYNENYYLDKYGDKETYATYCASFAPYAILDAEGVWHAPGEMGWWGMSSESSDDTKKWIIESEEVIRKANPKHSIFVVDCHI